MQPRESDEVFSHRWPENAEWNWSTFKGFGPKTWPEDIRGTVYSDLSCCKTIDESVRGARKIRSFKVWTIKLNGDNELIVEGTLECGTRARSKPIAERVTATKILSKMKHVYRLVGDITDPRNELPGFVCNRFNVGFPQDWEIVVAIWKGFASPVPFDSTTSSSFVLESFATEKKLRLDTAMEYQSQDDRMSRTISDVKQLAAWTPFVTSNAAGQSCLAFRGTLLSLMGYSVNKNHETDIVCRRLSARIIETVNRDFYELIGDLNNTKRSVPKELVMSCRNGCPKQVYLFCEKWKSLRGDETQFDGSLPDEKHKQPRTRQSQSISLITCREESTNSITRRRGCSMSPRRSIVPESNKRKRPMTESSENCIAGNASIDNDTNRDKKLRSRKQYKIIRKMSSNSSETSSGEKEDIAEDERTDTFEGRPINGKKKIARLSSPLKPMPSISFVYHKISPLTESVLSDGV